MKHLFEPGQQIETKIVAITDDTIFLDLGLKSEGILDKSELADENGNVDVKEGDTIKVYFLSNNRDELHFTTKLSGKDAGKETGTRTHIKDPEPLPLQVGSYLLFPCLFPEGVKFFVYYPVVPVTFAPVTVFIIIYIFLIIIV